MDDGGINAGTLTALLPLLLAVGAGVRWISSRQDKRKADMAAEAERYVQRLEKERDDLEDDVRSLGKKADHYRRVSWDYWTQARKAGLDLVPPSPEYPDERSA